MLDKYSEALKNPDTKVFGEMMQEWLNRLPDELPKMKQGELRNWALKRLEQAPKARNVDPKQPPPSDYGVLPSSTKLIILSSCRSFLHYLAASVLPSYMTAHEKVANDHEAAPPRASKKLQQRRIELILDLLHLTEPLRELEAVLATDANLMPSERQALARLGEAEYFWKFLHCTMSVSKDFNKLLADHAQVNRSPQQTVLMRRKSALIWPQVADALDDGAAPRALREFRNMLQLLPSVEEAYYPQLSAQPEPFSIEVERDVAELMERLKGIFKQLLPKYAVQSVESAALRTLLELTQPSVSSSIFRLRGPQFLEAFKLSCSLFIEPAPRTEVPSSDALLQVLRSLQESISPPWLSTLLLRASTMLYSIGPSWISAHLAQVYTWSDKDVHRMSSLLNIMRMLPLSPKSWMLMTQEVDVRQRMHSKKELLPNAMKFSERMRDMFVALRKATVYQGRNELHASQEKKILVDEIQAAAELEEKDIQEEDPRARATAQARSLLTQLQRRTGGTWDGTPGSLDLFIPCFVAANQEETACRVVDAANPHEFKRMSRRSLKRCLPTLLPKQGRKGGNPGGSTILQPRCVDARAARLTGFTQTSLEEALRVLRQSLDTQLKDEDAAERLLPLKEFLDEHGTDAVAAAVGDRSLVLKIALQKETSYASHLQRLYGTKENTSVTDDLLAAPQ